MKSDTLVQINKCYSEVLNYDSRVLWERYTNTKHFSIPGPQRNINSWRRTSMHGPRRSSNEDRRAGLQVCQWQIIRQSLGYWRRYQSVCWRRYSGGGRFLKIHLFFSFVLYWVTTIYCRVGRENLVLKQSIIYS